MPITNTNNFIDIEFAAEKRHDIADIVLEEMHRDSVECGPSSKSGELEARGRIAFATELSDVLKNSQSTLDSKNHELDMIKDKLEAREKEIAELRAVANAAKDELQSANDKLHYMNRRYRELEEENSILRHNNEGIVDHHVGELASKERHEVGSAAEPLHEETGCLKRRCRVLEQEKSLLSNELKVVSDQLDESFKIFALHTSDKEALDGKLTLKKKELEDAQTRGREMYEELAETRKNLQQLVKENTLLKTSVVADLWSAASSEKVTPVKRSSLGASISSCSESSEASDQGNCEVSTNSLTRHFFKTGANQSASLRRGSFLSLSSWRKGSEEASEESSQKDYICYENRGDVDGNFDKSAASFLRSKQLHERSKFVEVQNSFKNAAMPDAQQLLPQIEHKEPFSRSA